MEIQVSDENMIFRVLDTLSATEFTRSDVVRLKYTGDGPYAARLNLIKRLEADGWEKV